MRRRDVHSTRRSSCTESDSPAGRARLLVSFLIFALALVLVRTGAAATDPAENVSRGLDAYFGEQPSRAVTLLGDAMARPETRALREPILYVLGKSFAALHLYEKSEDSLRRILFEFPQGRFAPLAIRELARIFFELREYGAVINLEQSYRGTLAAGAYPPEFWYLVGQSNYLLGRKAEAREPLFRIALGNDWYPYARFTLAQVEFSQGRPDRALTALAEVTSDSSAPPLLRERATRIAGMILYEQRRYADAIQAYRGIDESSTLFAASRLDLALAAEAVGDTATIGEALSDAIQSSTNDFVRAEAQVAFGRLFNRASDTSKARTLFDKAKSDLRERETKLRGAVVSDAEFRAAFDELVSFARQNRSILRRQRLNEDLQILREALGAAGFAYRHEDLPTVEKVAPKTYLFDFLHEHFHDPALIEVFVELTVEIEDFRREVEAMAETLGDSASLFTATPATNATDVPAELADRLKSLQWLILADFDLTSRFYDALAVSEQLDSATAIREKQDALARTTQSLRILLLGSPELPSRQALMASLERASKMISAGELKGLASTKIRQGFLQELRSDHDSIGYVLENLQLKERQMAGALRGVGLRARNLNLPVLTTMSEWLAALQQLETKYRYIELERDDRPWHLAGRGGDLQAVLARSTQGLDTMRARAVAVLRETSRRLIEKEQTKHSLILAQAEEGIADSLFDERAGR